MHWVRLLTAALVASLGVLAPSTPAAAASYRGIGPYYTLNDVKAIFPQADVTFDRPAWAQPHETLVKVTGGGIDGTIVICLVDYRDYYRLNDNQKQAKPYLGINYATDTNNSLVVQWVRHVPEYYISTQTLVSIHGRGYKKSHRRDNYRPYISWDAKGVNATLSADSKWVSDIEYNFTIDECRKRLRQLIANPKPPTYIPTPQESEPDDEPEAGEDPIENVDPAIFIPRTDGENPEYGDIVDKYVTTENGHAWRKCIWDGSVWRVIKE